MEFTEGTKESISEVSGWDKDRGSVLSLDHSLLSQCFLLNNKQFFI